jgi:hypothetical protein
MAYVLGILYTDGCLSMQIHHGKTSTRRTPIISLAQKDRELIDKLLHFIRGCWDGDGSVYSEKRNPTNIKASFVSGSLPFIKGILMELEKVGLPKRKIYIKEGKKPSYYFRYSGSQCIKLYHYLYDDVPPTEYLERKHSLFKKYVDQHRERSRQTVIFE